MNTIRIAVADDNRELVDLLSDYLNSQPEMEVVAKAYNGHACIEMLKDHPIDVLVLDIVMPHLDGIGALAAIKQDEKLRDIEVIMLSAFGQESIMSQAVQYGASYFLMKPFEPERLAVQINHIMYNGSEKHPEENQVLSIEEQITNVVKEVGVPPHLKGYGYLKQAISLVLDNPAILNKVTKSLYPAIAGTYDTTPARVERSIRHAIEIVWTRGDIQHISKIVGYSNEHLQSKPTNSEFIAMLSDSIPLEDSASQ
ncbi:sporulation transcription factor Spo0A [Planococcus salinus]|uniref:Stage 0 sporulation protein A homolog n=1 Tax=Planococcus salinus TaxID=1848460 RepID=A0A3M8PBS0_9BACL|nr:sporulation transcription factor Spo0A [Planococcus salinus]RNF41083.1 sporulation transcription factor Spo0A [Planococcus salinus]